LQMRCQELPINGRVLHHKDLHGQDSPRSNSVLIAQFLPPDRQRIITIRASMSVFLRIADLYLQLFA
jgi:hypothetical protein